MSHHILNINYDLLPWLKIVVHFVDSKVIIIKPSLILVYILCCIEPVCVHGGWHSDSEKHVPISVGMH